uniref:Glutaredoxin domain-containing protein n=1 Tax=Araucaria cunninghamii TaxID=56994 RepID=A0A0D6RAR0_ARACU
MAASLNRARVGVSVILAMMCALSASLNVDAADSHAAFVKSTISNHKIAIFSKSYCPYCARAKSVFKELNVTPHVVELDLRGDGGEIQQALGNLVGRRTVPQVFIDGKHIGGSDDTVEAYQNGQLAKLLGLTNDEELELR